MRWPITKSRAEATWEAVSPIVPPTADEFFTILILSFPGDTFPDSGSMKPGASFGMKGSLIRIPACLDDRPWPLCSSRGTRKRIYRNEDLRRDPTHHAPRTFPPYLPLFFSLLSLSLYLSLSLSISLYLSFSSSNVERPLEIVTLFLRERSSFFFSSRDQRTGLFFFKFDPSIGCSSVNLCIAISAR